MRFLLFSAQYLPTVGGVERYTHSLAQTLAGMGHSVTVATSALPGLAAEACENGVRVLRLPSFLWMNGRFPSPRRGRAFKRAAAALWAQSYDYALIQTRFYPLSVWAAGQCRRRGIPALVLEHGTAHLTMGSPLLNLAGHFYEHLAVWLIRRHCTRFYGVSRASAGWLSHFGIQAAGVLYNAVDTAALAAIAAAPPCRFRGRLGIGAAAPLVAFSGRFIDGKGVFELLDAFALLRQKLPDATLVMAGDGPLFKQAQARVIPGAFLTGALPYEENIALLAQADAYCLPTRYAEGFPTTVLEAAALGTCVVATPAGGTPELVRSGQTGVLLEDTAPAAIAAALYRVLAAPAQAAAMGAAARAEVEKRFTWPAVAGELIRLARRDAPA